jgi:Uma2 family endonuclease
MASLPDCYLSPEEYLSLERRAEFKSEYVDGVAYARAGSSEQHNLITANLITELNIQLRTRDCKI